MVLLAFDSGPLRKAIACRLQASGMSVVASPSSEEWFERASGAKCVVYAPVGNLLRGTLDPEPDAARMRRLLGVANAAGARTVVVVVPKGKKYDLELDVLRRDGTPYVVVESSFLLEEIGAAMSGDRQIWVPRIGRIAASTARAVGDTVGMAVELEPHGRTLHVEEVHADLASLFQRAAQSAGGAIRVHAVPPAVFDFVRPIARWIRGKEPRPLALADELRHATPSSGAEGHSSPPRALPGRSEGLKRFFSRAKSWEP